MNCSAVRRAKRVDSHQSVDSHGITRRVEHIVPKRLDQSAAVRLVFIALRVMRICDLIEPDVDFGMSIVGEI